MSTVPVFAPDGALGDIPQEQLAAAVKAGAKPGVTMKAPDGSLGVIPADQMVKAWQAGGRIVPEGPQPITKDQVREAMQKKAEAYGQSMQLVLGLRGMREAATEAKAPPAESARTAPPASPASPAPQAAPAQTTPAPQSAPIEPTSPNFQMPAVREPVKVPPIKASDFALEHKPMPGDAVHSVVDEAIPPTGKTQAANALTKARIDFHLNRGDAQAAQTVFDQAKPQPVNQFPPEAPRVVPATQNIRENDAMVRAAQAQPGPKAADSLEDKAIQQEMQWNLEKHGWMAESEARREFIARNSTGVTKGELAAKFNAQKANLSSGKLPEATPATSDLTPILQKSLDAAKAAKMKKLGQ